MKGRTKRQIRRLKKRAQREASQYKSLGDSHYARKVKRGQEYGPAPTKEEVNRLVSPEARVKEG